MLAWFLAVVVMLLLMLQTRVCVRAFTCRQSLFSVYDHARIPLTNCTFLSCSHKNIKFVFYITSHRRVRCGPMCITQILCWLDSCRYLTIYLYIFGKVSPASINASIVPCRVYVIIYLNEPLALLLPKKCNAYYALCTHVRHTPLCFATANPFFSLPYCLHLPIYNVWCERFLCTQKYCNWLSVPYFFSNSKVPSAGYHQYQCTTTTTLTSPFLMLPWKDIGSNAFTHSWKDFFVPKQPKIFMIIIIKPGFSLDDDDSDEDRNSATYIRHSKG